MFQTKITNFKKNCTTEGTAQLANVNGYEVGGKTGTAKKSVRRILKKKINTFAHFSNI